MSGECPRFAFVVAPVPLTMASRTADGIASSVRLLVLGIVVAGGFVRHILVELALSRECVQLLEDDEPTEVNW